jgi:hypothetical protein
VEDGLSKIAKNRKDMIEIKKGFEKGGLRDAGCCAFAMCGYIPGVPNGTQVVARLGCVLHTRRP